MKVSEVTLETLNPPQKFQQFLSDVKHFKLLFENIMECKGI